MQEWPIIARLNVRRAFVLSWLQFALVRGPSELSSKIVCHTLQNGYGTGSVAIILHTGTNASD